MYNITSGDPQKYNLLIDKLIYLILHYITL